MGKRGLDYTRAAYLCSVSPPDPLCCLPSCSASLDYCHVGKWARGGWAASDDDERRVKEETQATLRCFPFEQVWKGCKGGMGEERGSEQGGDIDHFAASPLSR